MANRPYLLLATLLSWSLAGPTTAAADEPFEGRIECTLAGALIQLPDKPLDQQEPKDLTVLATCRDGTWQDVWGHALRFSKGHHRGAIRQAGWDGDHLTIELAMRLTGDPWVRGGAGIYRLELERQGEQLTGTYQGTYAYGPEGPIELQGVVTGSIRPATELGRSLAAVAALDGPRLLFQQDDLPRLKKKLQTPFGQAVRQRLEAGKHPVGLGLLYQLTGDASYAERAIEPVRAIMAETAGGAFAIGRVWGYRAETVAYAYDCCRDAWSPAVRREVESWIDWIAPRCIDRPSSLSSAVNNTPGSNYMVVIWGGAGLASIARLGDQAPPPAPPRDDYATARRIVPPTDWTPGAGVPSNQFADNTMPTDWLWAGGWLTRAFGEEEPLDALGGPTVAHERIATGTTIALDDQQSSFQALAAEQLWQNGKAMDLAQTFVPPGGKKEDSYFRTGYFFCALQVDEEAPVRLLAPPTGCNFDAIWVSGERLLPDDLCTLTPGLHPMLMRVQSMDLIPNPWGAMLCEPRFEVLPVAALERLTAGRAIELQVLQELHQRDLVDYEASGGDLARLQLARRAAHWNDLNCRGSMGDGGFQAEGESYTQECLRPLIGYAAAYRQLTGQDLNGRPDASHFAPRYLATTVWPGGMHKNRPAYHNLTWGGGGGTIEGDYVARGWSICPPDWRAELLWFWQQRTGADADDRMERARQAIAGWPAGIDLAYAFIHYPLDMAAASPATTDFPRFWAADGKGFYSFRNAFDGVDDIVVQCYAKDGLGAGWNAAEAGGFQIYGLGSTWAKKAMHDRGGDRWAENVVQLPGLQHRESSRCPVLHRSGDPTTGSGQVAVDLTPVYQLGKPHPKKKKKTIWYDAGLTGDRSLAVDYSGAAGVPACIAIADRISGTDNQKVWTMHVPEEVTIELQPERQGFVLRSKDASLVGTYAGTGELHLLPPAGDDAVKSNDKNKKRKKKKGKQLHAIRIGSSAADYELIVVLTLQRGDAPDVQIDLDKGRIQAGDLRWRLTENRRFERVGD